MVSNKTMIVDRIIADEFGGRYTRDNIRPHCSTCSGRQGARRTAQIRAATSGYTDDDTCRSCGVNFWAGLLGPGHRPGCRQPALDRGGWD